MKAFHSALIPLVMVTAAIFFLARASRAEELDSQAKALLLIEQTANSLCQSIPLEQHGSETTLSGKGSAQLNSVINKVVDLGVEGAARYKDSSSQGILQKDLVEALKNSTSCRLEVFNRLVDRLVPQIQPTVVPPPSRPQDSRTAYVDLRGRWLVVPTGQQWQFWSTGPSTYGFVAYDANGKEVGNGTAEVIGNDLLQVHEQRTGGIASLRMSSGGDRMNGQVRSPSGSISEVTLGRLKHLRK